MVYVTVQKKANHQIEIASLYWTLSSTGLFACASARSTQHIPSLQFCSANPDTSNICCREIWILKLKTVPKMGENSPDFNPLQSHKSTYRFLLHQIICKSASVHWLSTHTVRWKSVISVTRLTKDVIENIFQQSLYGLRHLNIMNMQLKTNYTVVRYRNVESVLQKAT